MQNAHSRALALLIISLTIFTHAHSADAPKRGAVPPTYVGRPLGGGALNIEPLDGRAHVVTFWASWCGPCLQELPVLANIQKIAGPDSMQVIAVNVEGRDVYRRLEVHITQLGLTSTFDPDKTAQKAFGVNGLPHMVIVGRDGRITSIRTGFSEAGLESLAAQLNAALSVPPATAGGD